MKGHSERIPGKNLRVFAGRPLYSWVLDALQLCTEVSVIAVNTDSDDIAAGVRRWSKVVVHRRPAEICGDFVSMNRVIADDVERLAGHDLFVQTHATNPLLSASTLQRAFAEFSMSSCSSMFTVTRHQARFYSDTFKPINHRPGELLRTQDLPPLYEENSLAYLFSRKSFSERGRRIGPDARPFETPKDESIDIDTEDEWKIAEAVRETRDAEIRNRPRP